MLTRRLIVCLDVKGGRVVKGPQFVNLRADGARRTAERLFVPLTIGGGVRTADDVARALRAGADKVSINSAAVARPAVLTESADRFGAQCVVASIDAKWD